MKRERIEQLLHAIVTRYCQNHLPPNLTGGIMTTLTQVTLSPRLDKATFYLSFFGGKDPIDQETFLKQYILPHSWPIRKEIAQQLRHKVGVVPKEIVFHLDPIPTQAAAIEALLAHIKSKG